MAFDITAFKTTDALADIGIRIANAATDYVATEVLPVKTVPKSHFKWTQFDKSALYSRDTAKASKAEADKASFGGFQTSGQAILHKLAGEVDPQDERDVDNIARGLDEQTVATVMGQLLVDMEVKAHALVTAAGNYPSGLTTSLTTDTTTWNVAGGDPIQVFKDGRKAVRDAGGRLPTTAVVSWETMEALRVHPSLIERIKYTGTQLRDEDIGRLVGVDRFIIAKAQKVATREPVQTLSSIWGDSVVLFSSATVAANMEEPLFGRTFMVDTLYTHRYQDDKRGSGAGRIKVVEMGWEYVQRLVAVESVSSAKTISGYLIQNAI